MLKIRPISKQVDIVPGCIRKSNVQGGKKYFPSWEPRFLGQYFARDSVIPEPAVALQNLIFNGSRGFIAKMNLQQALNVDFCELVNLY